jgi:hypothetical protein
MGVRNAFVVLIAVGLVATPAAAQAGKPGTGLVAGTTGRGATAGPKGQQIDPGLIVAILVTAGAGTYGLVDPIGGRDKGNGPG